MVKASYGLFLVLIAALGAMICLLAIVCGIDAIAAYRERKLRGGRGFEVLPTEDGKLKGK
jgi:hypothetical protein